MQAELIKRERTVVLRRLNRSEYRNTIRDLIGVDFDTSGFPQDPPAGGFDNNGGALTLSPLHVEMYLQAAQQILDRALVEGDRPAGIKWRFVPKVGDMDRTRVRLDKDNNAIVNGGNNQQEGEWVVVHHESWDKGSTPATSACQSRGSTRFGSRLQDESPRASRLSPLRRRPGVST